MIQQITSRSNPTIKELCKLKQKKYRQQFHQLLLEGERLVKDAFSRGAVFDYVLVRDGTDLDLTDFMVRLQCPILICNDIVWGHISNTQSPQDLIAVAHFMENKFALPQKNFLLLDNIQDPGNLGTIIRTATAFDFTDIYLYNCVDYTNEKVLRATMGTIFTDKIYQVNLSQITELSRLPLYSAEMSGVDINTIEFNIGSKGLILSNEANGISQELITLTNKKITIPMTNEVESLNVAIAGAIIMNKMK